MTSWEEKKLIENFTKSCETYVKTMGKLPTKIWLSGESDMYIDGKNVSELFRLFNGMSESMQTAIVKIMEVTQTTK